MSRLGLLITFLITSEVGYTHRANDILTHTKTSLAVAYIPYTCPIYTNGCDSSNRWSIGTNRMIGTNRQGCHSSGSVSEYASQ